MKTLRNHFEIQRTRAENDRLATAEGRQLSVGFVPTMGALHEGHLSLVNAAKEQCDHVYVSIFLNPTQFNNADDLLKYPKSLDEDVKMLTAAGVDYLYTPTFNDVYPDNYRFKISESQNSKLLCGAHRPGHFDGVLTVVMRLLNIVQPDFCFMGEKDYQQFLLIHEMAASFFMKTQIVPCPTVREPDGLAMSSRNRRLSETAREKAPLIYKLLSSDFNLEAIRSNLEENGFAVDYVEELWGRRFAAATIEGVRLIDNVPV